MEEKKEKKVPAVQGVPIADKYALTVFEAAEYFSLGYKKIRQLAMENLGRFSIRTGNKYLIIRKKFEAFLDKCSEV